MSRVTVWAIAATLPVMSRSVCETSVGQDMKIGVQVENWIEGEGIDILCKDNGRKQISRKYIYSSQAFLQLEQEARMDCT